ncbi:hypothetical protein PPTG_12077 [Phytophthora nicotianae INRA-310]|uniref:Uncharacterized protein n=1 Tax=Phytophthora nicotianae (strain INRA-310) TaxID=761204 RepID=W2Q5U3_PHYN3|nr:hypothetical protein PPTG_12077 [Phytophthora nicotianae INRA-310]ETN08241.1 hypothetical protein PPTG_12077 [Phytophthora nicotianae INRA-310]
MADIEDEAEFEDMLKFVMNKWRNVRQKKVAIENETTTASGLERISQSRRFTDTDVKTEFGIDSSDEEDTNTGSAKDESTKDKPADASSNVSIRLNPKWERPRRRERKLLKERKLIEKVQPDFREVQRRLSGVSVKYGDAETIKPKLQTMKNSVLVQDAFYLLLTKLLDTCLKLLPLSNSEEDAISVDSSQPSQETTQKKSESVETLVIKDVGSFSRQQIETFKRVENLKRVVTMGLDMHKWLLEVGIPSHPAQYHDKSRQVAAEVLSSYPYTRIPGLPDAPEYSYAMLYRAVPPMWLTDAAILALCWRLTNDYCSSRFAGFLPCVATTRRKRNAKERPIEEARIFYYDPMNQAAYNNTAKAVDTNLKISGLHDVAKKRRFELFYYLLSGCLLPLERPTSADTMTSDDTEEKMRASTAAGGDSDDDDLPPTQRAEK